ncbi:MAG: UDP-N-acetylmuramoyl-tripeptide--D-alanyl-D-alanine ligase [Chitinophagia bacterium]|nr:UDP-N-acetylmuramoyl-tripeptide--D-alanyl-D-alanine ligase [Chitinophagia bacterium]
MDMQRLYSFYQKHPKVQTDTRKIQPGEFFFALKGPNFNGNQYALKALEMGAAGVVVDEPIEGEGEHIFRVDDVLTTLQQLALHHRQQFKIPFIAITGSNGKTTTKELIHAVLSSTYRTYTTKGNLNNHIGIPLTLLSIGLDAEMAIVEMGANHQKEIEAYCKIALPTHGLITNCGKAHMEGFGGVMGVRKGKGELYDYLGLSDGTVFLNSELDYLLEMSQRIKNKIFYGNKKGNFNAAVLQSEPLLTLEVSRLDWGLHHLHTNLVGAYNLPNIEAAICIGDHFNIPFIKIAQAIATYVPDNARSQLIKKDGNDIILDAYNANPSSMQVAIENFANQSSNNKFLFLGGMMELGEDSVKEHQAIVDLLIQKRLNKVTLVGGDFEKTTHPFQFFRQVDEAKAWLAENKPHDALLLIKGSRSTRMEKLMDAL